MVFQDCQGKVSILPFRGRLLGQFMSMLAQGANRYLTNYFKNLDLAKQGRTLI
jgi:hypothetical protein